MFVLVCGLFCIWDSFIYTFVDQIRFDLIIESVFVGCVIGLL